MYQGDKCHILSFIVNPISEKRSIVGSGFNEIVNCVMKTIRSSNRTKAAESDIAGGIILCKSSLYLK